ncbi:Hypothetical predicted protein [Podarcis lilfordi]|uniref:Uncharacterized protein n=1 Tax=Podarcis lilfordi TaxID=74358 RepID=A0AA35L748_9SAUR|nr:Hypothetical predicted protein [Podarcis lilfordi]
MRCYPILGQVRFDAAQDIAEFSNSLKFVGGYSGEKGTPDSPRLSTIDVVTSQLAVQESSQRTVV